MLKQYRDKSNRFLKLCQHNNDISVVKIKCFISFTDLQVKVDFTNRYILLANVAVVPWWMPPLHAYPLGRFSTTLRAFLYASRDESEDLNAQHCMMYGHELNRNMRFSLLY